METIILSLGGSVFVPDKVNVDFLKKFRKLVLDYTAKGRRMIIVTGGGNLSRRYMGYAKQADDSVSEENLDWVGIAGTKLNAELLRAVFGDKAYKDVATNPTAAIKTDRKIIVGSGWIPGCSTDKDAVLLAKNFKAKTVVNMTNVDYVYDKNPSKYKDAKPIKQMSWEDMTELVGEKWKPGSNLPFDPVASRKAEDLGLKVIILGNSLDNFKKFLEGKSFKGTVIK